MKLSLIKPNIGRMEHSLYVDEGRMEPLQLGVLAGLAPPDIEVALYDDRCEAIPYDEPTDLAAITVETYTARRAYEISACFRERGVPVVLGGFHPTLLPDEAAEHADAIVVGDAEPVWVELLRDAEHGTLQPRYRGATLHPQSETLPRRDLFHGKGYLPISLIQFGRGCQFPCTYCAISSFFERRHVTRPVEEVVREIEAQGRKNLFFVDDNIVANHQKAKELFRALIPLRVRWVSQGSINMVYDRELMELMVESGCLGHVIGFESTESEGLKALKKSPNLRAAGDYEHEVGVLREFGLQTWAAFVVGHDFDTPETLERQYQFALRHKFTFAAWNILMPYPGTPLYEDLRHQNRLLYGGKWWLHPDYRFNHAAFQPARMSAQQLTDHAFRMRADWNRPTTVLRRFFEPRTNMRTLTRMGVYWAYNPLFRKEVFKKQGMRFGLNPRPICDRFSTHMKLVIATRNPHKLSEIRAILDLPGVQLLSADELPGLPDVDEDGETLEANAIKKAVTLARHSGLWAIADDTGLEVEALNGAPGVYSARYAGENVSYADNNRKLLAALDGVSNRRARFRTAVALSDPEGNSRWVEGQCPGIIVEALRGAEGFGYDPLFLPDGHPQTFAEMDGDTKNTLSHRARAFARAREDWADLLKD